MLSSLSHEMWGLLKQCLTRNRPDLLNIVETNRYVDVPPELGNELREAVLDALLKVGLKADHEPNEIGLKLASLIDAIGRMSMDSECR